MLDKQNPLQKCVFPAYGPVWAGHKAQLYALHLPFDVYNAILEGFKNKSFWTVSGSVAAGAPLVMSLRIERINRDVI